MVSVHAQSLSINGMEITIATRVTVVQAAGFVEITMASALNVNQIGQC